MAIRRFCSCEKRDLTISQSNISYLSYLMGAIKNPDEGKRYGLWELAVLCFLRESPMHPYEIQRLLRARNKDILLDLKKGSLYNAIRRLLRSGMIEAIETRRNGLRPQHTTYRLTAGGQ